MKRELELWLTDELSMEFCLIDCGSFHMGSHTSSLGKDLRYPEDWREEPRHRIALSPYYLGCYPVTQAQFRIWTEGEGMGFKHSNWFEGKDQHPAEDLSWVMAMQYCDWLNRAVLGHARNAGLLPGHRLVALLPTEAQWEGACRRWQGEGAATEFCNGDGEAALQQTGWFGEEFYNGSTQDVYEGTKKSNDYGMYHMHGNVREWCLDAYDAQAYARRAAGTCNPLVLTDDEFAAWHGADEGAGSVVTSASMPEEENTQRHLLKVKQRLAALGLDVQPTLQAGGDAARVLRGGSWGNWAGDCRSASRDGDWPVNAGWSWGFRVCLLPDPEARPAAPTDSAQRSTAPAAQADRLEAGQARAAGDGHRGATDLSREKF